VQNAGVMGRRVLLASIFSIVAVAWIAALPARSAWADGDPASDYLITNQVFLTSQSAAVSPAQRELLAVVRAANRRGFAIRVAVISSEYDMGSITALWRKPGIYARFLGLELASAYRGRLLVVMPNGFGFNWPGHSAAAADGLLAKVLPGTSADGFAAGAQVAVRRLSSAAGVTLGRVPVANGGRAASSGGRDVAVIAGLGVGALAVIAAVVLVVPRLRRRGARPWTGRAAENHRGVRVRLRWVIPGAALLCAIGVAVAVVGLRRGGVSDASTASVVTPPPFSWAAGRRPAPDFVLRDQQGRPVSIAAYRGRPVIVTFIDPLCRNLCPLEAQVLNQVEREMPVSQRPVILAVSVDVYADARADLLQDVREWHLVPQWRWGVGAPAQLAGVWRRYGVGVLVVTKRISGTAIHYITHTEAAYIVDSTGHERALFFWPFYPQDVERALQKVA
jgi:protein SCO1